MRIFLSIVAFITLLAPVAAWTYLVALGCAYNTSNSRCDIRLGDYWDEEFLMLAALPWVIGIACLFAVWRRR